MQRYISLALAVFFVIGGVFVEHSIYNVNAHTTSGTPWMTYGLEWFVCIIWALGMFVIGAIHKDFSSDAIASEQRAEQRRIILGA